MKLAASLKRLFPLVSLSLLVSCGSVPVANAEAIHAAASSGAANANLQLVISAGDVKIADRQTALTTLSAKVASLTKVSAASKASLTSGISSTASGLATLKAKLDADTDLPTARSDAQSIATSFRVYLLVIPQVHLVKVADDQLATQAKLTAVASRLAKAVNNSSQKATLSAQLSDATTNLQQAAAISTSDETKILALQPSDYNANHQLVVNYLADLKTAQAKEVTAYGDLKAVAGALKV